ncbi:MAG TPA: efflux RND transporter periplasmic adaptor subunit [Pirellulales bacterium]|nr:efflux RND transporter periplasmic adaptor subunit [Pirellulales bacterium]
MKTFPIPTVLLVLVSLSLPACSKEEHHEEVHKIVPTYPQSQAVTLTQQYVCQIHSQRHIKVRALEMGYLEAITVKEGQAVKEGDLLFKVIPILYQKNAEVRKAEASLAQLEYKYSQQLLRDDVVSKNEVLLLEAKMKRAEANADLATAELNFATVKASFDGIIDRLYQQQGSLVQKGEVLTTMSDNSVMWVYFNVPEARYLEYVSNLKQNEELQIELVLANGNKFDQLGKMAWDGNSWKTGAIEADFNNQTGNISFRADFPNPGRLLRHGQTGTVLISKVQKDAVVIPQKATFEVLAKRYVYVVDDDNVAHQREIAVEHDLDDIFVIKSGVDVNEKIVLEGIRQIRDGDKVEIEDHPSGQLAANLSRG